MATRRALIAYGDTNSIDVVMESNDGLQIKFCHILF